MERKEILPLTGLRFIAALYVFLFHIHIRWPLSNHTFLKNLLGQGAIGMSIFFILSGFVLAYQYANRPTTYKQFVVNRFARIYPMYVFVTILTLPWIGINFTSNMAHGILQAIFLIIINIFVLQAWFPPFFRYWHDGGSWSIGVEVFCYALLPVFLPTLVRFSIKALLLVLIGCFIFAALPGLSAKVFINPDTPVYYAIPIFRLPEFIAGVCTCLLIHAGFRFKINTALQIMILILFLLYVGFCGQFMPGYIGHNWIVVPFFGLAVYNLVINPSPLSWLLSTPFFVWLGKISYSFYLLQLLLILFLIDYHDQLVTCHPALANNTFFALISLAVLIIASALSYHFLEEPMRRFIKRRYK